MRSDGFLPCIVSVFDLIGTKKLAADGSGSVLMIQMQAFAAELVNNGMPSHDHAYLWNDSILLLSYQTELVGRYEVLCELREFKSKLEQQIEKKTYAICVQGMTFPQNELRSPVFNGPIAGQPRVTKLKASSWAMANCFTIEKVLGPKHKADWYIDSKIVKGLSLPKAVAAEAIEFLPSHKRRKVFMYRGPIP